MSIIILLALYVVTFGTMIAAAIVSGMWFMWLFPAVALPLAILGLSCSANIKEMSRKW